MVTLITPRFQIKKLRNTVRVAERLMKLAKSLGVGKATHGGRHDTVSERRRAAPAVEFWRIDQSGGAQTT
jgi:hypothetical protein